MEFELKNYCVKFFDNPNVIDDVSILVNENIFVFGDEDCGKSAFLKGVCGLVKNVCGEILLNKKPLNVKEFSVSLVLDSPVLLKNKTVEQNLIFSQNVMQKSEKIHKNEQIYKKFGLTELKNVKCKNLNLFQKRLVCLARAFVKQPKLLLLDDLFENINEEEQNLLLKCIRLFENCLIVATGRTIKNYQKLNFGKRYYLKFGKLKENFDDFEDLFLAKNFKNVKDCFLSERGLKLENNTEILLTDKQKQIIGNECLQTNCLKVCVDGDNMYLYDGVTGELVLSKK